MTILNEAMEDPTLDDDDDEGTSDESLETVAPPPAWTPEHVGFRLVEAMRTLDRLPRAKGPSAPGNHWPQHRLEGADRMAQAELPEAERRARDGSRLAELALRPDGAALDRMDRALDWLRALRAAEPELALVVTLWALRLARRRSIRALCRERGLAPATFHARRLRGLKVVAAALAARGERVR